MPLSIIILTSFYFFFTAQAGTRPDKSMFATSQLKQLIMDGKFLCGSPTFVNGYEYREFLLADSGYTNCSYMVTPIDLKGKAGGLSYEESYYNFRISRVRCKVEIAIGALKNRF